MSYCRWSSDDFQCDVYCYEHVYGKFVTHVASRKRVFKSPLPEPLEKFDIKKHIERDMKVMEMVREADLVPIGLPHDGEDFIDATPGECANRLEMLKKAGYRVPDYAIQCLREEEKELENSDQ